MRKAEITRGTSETEVVVKINLDGTGETSFSTGLPFLEHMLDQIGRHGLIDLDIKAKGDLHIDAHHSVEDCGITLGKALKKEIFPIENIERYGNATVVMDEASQIKPQDALGTIARGKQLVVVGDPKQLPPTSFFDKAVDNDDEDTTAIEQSESILDVSFPMFNARRLR